MNNDEKTFTDISDAAYALMTAPFVLFLVALVIGAAFVMMVKKQ